ncbi:MAG: hypothetical protein HY675_24215 [Chloroflexi bacterium]|nr:hypothetical protein [Chloroflexota bacterium]
MAIEDMRKPAVALCNEGFVADARSAASGRGMPGLRLVAEAIPPYCFANEEIEAAVTAAMGDIVDALTRSPTADELCPKPNDVAESLGIIFKGDLEEVNRFFYKRGWGDGLPIIPPTEEAVAEMLTGTDLAPDYVVGKIIPRLGKATVQKIAVNAVMAGALPTYMPLLIAGVEAAMDHRTSFGTHGVSTGSWAPFWIVNGPIRKEIHINSGTGALSPGDIANATIGRAIGLIIKNIGGARKAVEDMGVFGNPGKYTMVIAENEEESPWEPLHVQEGFDKADNTISLMFPNTTTQVFPYGSDDKGILNGAISNVIPGRRGLFCLMLIPAHAKTLAANGWTKKEIASFIAEYARVPAYRHPNHAPTRGLARSAVWQRPPNNLEDTMAVFSSPDWIRIVVAGGPGAFMCLAQSGGYASGEQWVTKKVELPRNWTRLVEKHKSLVPTYVRY